MFFKGITGYNLHSGLTNGLIVRDHANNDNEGKQLWSSLKFNDTLTNRRNSVKAIDKVPIKFYDYAISFLLFIVKIFQRL